MRVGVETISSNKALIYTEAEDARLNQFKEEEPCHGMRSKNFSSREYSTIVTRRL